MSKYILTKEDIKLVDKFCGMLAKKRNLEVSGWDTLGSFDCSEGRPIKEDVQIYVCDEEGEYVYSRYTMEGIKERMKEYGKEN